MNMHTSFNHHHQTRTFNSPPVLTPQAFHQAIGASIGLNTVYELLRAERLRHVRIGNRYLILVSEVHDFFEREASAGHEVLS